MAGCFCQMYLHFIYEGREGMDGRSDKLWDKFLLLLSEKKTQINKQSQFVLADSYLTQNILYLKGSNPDLYLLMSGEYKLTSGHHAGE